VTSQVFRLVVEKRPNYSRAACIGAPPEVFFPALRGPNRKVTIAEMKEARKYCSACVIQNECLEYACRTDSVGIWGGVYLSEHLARKLREKHGWTLQREIIVNT